MTARPPVYRAVPESVVLYEGPSEYDGAPIVALATRLVTPSHNAKTGPMVQVVVLRQDISPSSAVMPSTCGSCPAVTEGWCYVDLAKWAAAWKKYQRGDYEGGRHAHPHAVDMLAASRYQVRFGAFGNMSALPIEVSLDACAALLSAGKRWTLYEHEWRTCDQTFSAMAMASVEDVEGAALAADRGWRSFLVVEPTEVATSITALRARGIPAVESPYSATDGRVQCTDCGLCDGSRGPADRRPSIVNPIHGAPHKVGAFRKGQAFRGVSLGAPASSHSRVGHARLRVAP